MPRRLELHDSELVAISHEGGDAVVRLQGYVHQWDVVDGHWRGSGWIMPVVITISGATPAAASARGRIGHGTLTVGSTSYDNMVPLPLTERREVTLELSISDSMLVIRGRGVSVDVVAGSQARRVEALPDSWRPSDA